MTHSVEKPDPLPRPSIAHMPKFALTLLSNSLSYTHAHTPITLSFTYRKVVPGGVSISPPPLSLSFTHTHTHRRTHTHAHTHTRRHANDLLVLSPNIKQARNIHVKKDHQMLTEKNLALTFKWLWRLRTYNSNDFSLPFWSVKFLSQKNTGDVISSLELFILTFFLNLSLADSSNWQKIA